MGGASLALKAQEGMALGLMGLGVPCREDYLYAYFSNVHRPTCAWHRLWLPAQGPPPGPPLCSLHSGQGDPDRSV